MALSFSSILKAFFAMIVFYGIFAVLELVIETYTGTHSNVFDNLLIKLMPVGIFLVIIVTMFTNPDSRSVGGYR